MKVTANIPPPVERTYTLEVTEQEMVHLLRVIGSNGDYELKKAFDRSTIPNTYNHSYKDGLFSNMWYKMNSVFQQRR